jgi:hypothetical protein
MESTNDQLQEINSSETTKRVNNATSTEANQQDDTTPSTNIEATATVKILLVPINQIVTQALTLKTTINDIKAQLSENLKLSSENLVLIHSATSKLDSLVELI